MPAKLSQEMINQQPYAGPEGATGCDHDCNSQNGPAVERVAGRVFIEFRIIFDPGSEQLRFRSSVGGWGGKFACPLTQVAGDNLRKQTGGSVVHEVGSFAATSAFQVPFAGGWKTPEKSRIGFKGARFPQLSRVKIHINREDK
jgi:hypothetical protein